MTRKHSLILSVVVLMLLALYVGAYYGSAVRFRELLTRTVDARYPSFAPSRLWELFFAPVHWVDRLLRPDFWKL